MVATSESRLLAGIAFSGVPSLGDSNSKALSGTEDAEDAVSEVRASNPANDHRKWNVGVLLEPGGLDVERARV